MTVTLALCKERGASYGDDALPPSWIMLLLGFALELAPIHCEGGHKRQYYHEVHQEEC